LANKVKIGVPEFLAGNAPNTSWKVAEGTVRLLGHWAETDGSLRGIVYVMLDKVTGKGKILRKA